MFLLEHKYKGIYKEIAKMPNNDFIYIWTNFPMSYFATKTKILRKKYDGLIKLKSGFVLSFQSGFHIFTSRCVIFVIVCQNQLNSRIWANWQCFFPSIQLDFFLISWFSPLGDKSSKLGQIILSKQSSNLEQMK